MCIATHATMKIVLGWSLCKTILQTPGVMARGGINPFVTTWPQESDTNPTHCARNKITRWGAGTSAQTRLGSFKNNASNGAPCDVYSKIKSRTDSSHQWFPRPGFCVFTLYAPGFLLYGYASPCRWSFWWFCSLDLRLWNALPWTYKLGLETRRPETR